MITAPKPPEAPEQKPNDRPPQAASPPNPASFRALAGAPTPLGPAEASLHLAQAWQAVFGRPIPAPALDLLWAQWALETAHGRAMRGNNFGGLKTNRGGALLPTIEGFGAARVRVVARFRTYSTPDEGALDHVSLIARRFPLALAALERGDGPAFVDALAHGGYFTADPEAYRRGIERLAAEHAGRKRASASDPVPMDFVKGVLTSLRPRANEP